MLVYIQQYKTMIINVALLGTWGLPFVVNVRFNKTATDFNEYVKGIV